MSHTKASNLIAALGIATFERVAKQQFKLSGPIPGWLQDTKPEIQKAEQTLGLSELFPFLEYFLADAETLWSTNTQTPIKSGLWAEQGQAAQSLYLEASALCLGTQKILLITAQNDHITEKITLIQQARENSLNHLFDRKHNSQELVSSTFYDTLTGLPNQTYFSLQLTQAFEAQRQDQTHQTAVLTIEIDQFRLLKHSLGYAVGEQVLLEFAGCLRKCLTPEALLARSDGAEFTLLLPRILESPQATQQAEKILTALTPPFLINNQEIYLSTNIGLAISNADYSQSEDLLRDSHIAMEQAKVQGGSLMVVFAPFMQQQVIRHFQLKNDLHHAVGDQELQIHYQPTWTIQSERIIGFEAFVRWFHPLRGSVVPQSFLPVAESVGLMSAIDLWLMREACFRIQQWWKMMRFPLSVSINLSADQLNPKQLVQQIQQVLKETNINPHSLTLEFQEQVMLRQPNVFRSFLEPLKTLGVKLCLDDFSASYAALNALQTLPIDTLKIEPSCIRCLEKDSQQYRGVIHTVIQIAHELQITVGAKGVENRQELEALAEVGCDYAQGYVFSGPLNSTRATQILQRQ